MFHASKKLFSLKASSTFHVVWEFAAA